MASAANEVDTSGRAALAGKVRLPLVAGEISASKVFQPPQPVHCPCHFGEAAPQFWQINTSFDFAIGFLRCDL
jgi:hypothetical protein